MSRIGKQPIPIPQDVKVDLEGDLLTVRGPKGELKREIHPMVNIQTENDQVVVSVNDGNRKSKALHGLFRALIANMVTGVSQGFEKTVEIVGVGYRAQKVGDKLVLQVGFSHPVEILPLPDISFVVEGPNRVKVQGLDKELVGEMAARIRKVRPPDSYKGKGIRYAGETVHLKPGKAGKAIGKKK